MPDNKDEYEIGFGKPPKHTQFKQGRSGNPKGRPKGSKSLATIFNKLAEERVLVNAPNGSRYMSKIEIGVMQLLNRAAKGEPRAIREVMHWKKIFGDFMPQPVPPSIQVNFVRAIDGRPALPDNSEPDTDSYSQA